MRKHTIGRRISKQKHLLLLVLTVPLAFGQATRTWVSGVGDDANPCSRTAPCKTWAGAISKTSPAGEIDALDPGGFGAVTITKSITLDGGGFTAGVLVAGTNGIVVAAGATDVVTLRDLDINGVNSGLSGIQVNSAGNVTIDKVRIYGFLNNGVSINIPATGNTHVAISDSIIKDCATGNAVSASGTTSTLGNLYIVVNNLEAHNCLRGLIASGGPSAPPSKLGPPPTTGKVTVTARNSDFSNNVQGVTAGTNSTISLDNGNVAFCSSFAAITTDPTATIRLANMSITDNSTGLFASQGTILSFLNNRILGNTTDGSPTVSVSLR